MHADDAELISASAAEVARGSGKYTGCVVVDGLVVKIDEFAEHHPGGPAVLRANIGRDASADFAHVAAHSHPTVRQKLTRLAVARVADNVICEEWDKLLDHLCLVRNSFDLQFAIHRQPVLSLIYFAQSYCHFACDHLEEFTKSLGHWLTTTPQLHFCREHVEEVVNRTATTEDDVAAARLIQDMQDAVARGLSPLIDITSSAIRGTDGAESATRALKHVDAWLATERRYWERELTRKATGATP